jgi:peptide chain release factor 1
MLEALKDEFLAAEDNRVDSFFLEIRAGTGGEEAALFGRDLFRDVPQYLRAQGWRFDVSDFSASERGGFKEVIINIRGNGAYRHLQIRRRRPSRAARARDRSAGTNSHQRRDRRGAAGDAGREDRDQSQGRRRSGCRAAARRAERQQGRNRLALLHKPTGIAFKMTEHKSQAKTRSAPGPCFAPRCTKPSAKQHTAQTGARKAMMGIGDRSQRIRTYNFPQNRCTDHRLGGEGGGEKNFNLDQIMQAI